MASPRSCRPRSTRSIARGGLGLVRRPPIWWSPSPTSGARWRRCLPATEVTTISFIPSEETRRALAGIDPLAQLGVISRVPEFLLDHEARRAPVRAACRAVRRRGGRHRSARPGAVLVGRRGDRDRRRERSLQRLRAGQRAIAYRHIPDPGDVDRLAGALLADGHRFEAASIAGSSLVNVSEMNWSQVEAYLQRDDRAVAAARQHRAARRLSLSVDSILSREGRARCRRTARRPGVSGDALRPDAVFPGLSRHHQPAGRDLCRVDPRRPGRPGGQRLSPHPRWSTAMAATSRRRPSRSSGWRTIRRCRSSSTTGGTRRKPSPRCRRSIRSPRMRRGWRTFPGRGWRASRCRPSRSR